MSDRQASRRAGPFRALVPALLAALLLGLAACGEPEQAPTPPPPPPDDAYTRATQFVYEGGTGQGVRRGRTIHRDGLVEFWESRLDKQDGARITIERRRLGAAATATVFDAAREADFLGLEAGREAEFGFGMEMSGPDGYHRVAWPKAKEAPPVLRGVHRAVALLGAGLR